MKTRFYSMITGLVILATAVFHAETQGQSSNEGDRIIGKWLSSSRKSVCLIYRKGETFEGKITWYAESHDENGNLLTDQNNPDPKLRDRPVVGLVILKDLTYSEDDSWSGGEIYMPRTGKTYDCKITMLDENSLEVTAYTGLTFFGKSGIWTRQ